MTRRGKYLWLTLQDTRGAEQGGLLMHLGMSGSLNFSADAPTSTGLHDHFDLRTTQGTLRMTDPRRFGAVVWSNSLQADPAAKLLATLGMEPFDPDFNGKVLHQALRGRKLAIKQALLAGDIVVGAGNIYACEALFLAGIHPTTASGRVSLVRCERLAQAIQTVLAAALDAGGSTLRNFVDAHGHAGSFQDLAKVYGREGKPCVQCEKPIKRMVQGQRSSYFCGFCQAH